MSEFYVYQLVDPRDGAIFYVGKGKGDRVRHHVRQAKRGRIGNQEKHDRIIAILADGRIPVEMIVAEFDDEREAIDHEEDLIKFHGIENLTNKKARGTLSVGPTTVEDQWMGILHIARLDMRSVRPEVVKFGREFEDLALAMLSMVRKRVPSPCQI